MVIRIGVLNMDDSPQRHKFLKMAVQKGYITLDGLLSLIDNYAAMSPASGHDYLMTLSSRLGDGHLETPPGRTAN